MISIMSESGSCGGLDGVGRKLSWFKRTGTRVMELEWMLRIEKHRRTH